MSGDEENAVVQLNPLPSTLDDAGLDKAIENYRPAPNELSQVETTSKVSQLATPHDLSSFELGEAQGYVGAIREYVAPEDWGEVEASFDGLSDAGKTTVLQHLAMGTTGSARPLTDAEMTTLLSELDIAPVLAEHWGHNAARKFGVVRQRFKILEDHLSAGDWSRVLKLYYEGPASAAIAISCAMAGN